MAIQDDFTIYPDSKVIRHTSGTTVYTMTQFHSYLMNTFDEPGYLSYETPIKFNTPTSFTMINGWFLDDGDGSDALQFLTAGGLDTLGYATVSDPIWMMDLDRTTGANFVAADKDKIIRNTDDAANIGPLLTFKVGYPSGNLTRMWVRNTLSATIPDAADGIEATTGGGTGDYTDNTLGPAIVGDEIYHNVFTIATFAGTPDPQVYMYQNHPVSGTRTRIAEWSNLTNWDRGTIDVLIPVQLGGALIDSGNVTTFVRQTGDSYTLVVSTFDAAGRTGIATETAADTVNITKGEHYLFYDSVSNPGYSAGTIIQDVATGGASPPTWYAEIVAHTNWTASSGYITIRGYRGAVTDTDAIYVGAAQLGTATVNGTGVGDTIVSFDAETGTLLDADRDLPLVGATSGAERILKGIQDDTGSGKLLLAVHHPHTTIDSRDYTGTTRNALYKQFVDDDVVSATPSGTSGVSATLDTTITPTTVISGYSDITILPMNGTITTGSFTSGPFTRGERVTWNAGSSEAFVIDWVTDTSLSLAGVDPTDEPVSTDVILGDISGASATASAGLTDDNTEDFNHALQSAYDYTVFIEGGTAYEAGRSLSDIYAYLQYYIRDGQDTTQRTIYTSNGTSITALDAEEYIKADSSYSTALAKNAPFGTLAGSTFFGKRGVWLQGMQTSDANNIVLIDHNDNQRTPEVSVTVTISNTRVDDRIALFLEDGTTELPDKDTYTSHNTLNTLGRQFFDEIITGGGFPNDTPTSGTFIVVEDGLSKQHRYRYETWVNTGGSGDDGKFNLPTELTGTADGSTASEILEDSSENYSATVQVGDIVHRTSGTLGFAYVTDVSSAASGILGTTLIEDTTGTANTAWAVADTFAIHSLVVAYTNADTFFIPYIDEIEIAGTDAAPGSITQTLTYTSAREVVLFARNVENTLYEIVPFKTTGSITSSGLTLSVIRNEDTIYTP